MLTVLHTAGWNLGASLRWGGWSEAAVVRAAKLAAVERLAARARADQVDLVVVAGDLFADNHVSDDVMEAARGLLADFAPVAVWLVPGQGDAMEVPSALSRLGVGEGRLSHVRCFEAAEVVTLEGVTFGVCPLSRRRPLTDPTSELPACDTDTVGLVVSHGRVEDVKVLPTVLHRIHARRLTESGWDALLLGGSGGPAALDEYAFYAGAVEVAGPDTAAAGWVTRLEIADGRVTASPLRVGALSWWEAEFTVLAGPDVDELEQAITALSSPENTIGQVKISGRLPSECRARLDALVGQLREQLAACAVTLELEWFAEDTALARLDGALADAASMLRERDDRVSRDALVQLVMWAEEEARS